MISFANSLLPIDLRMAQVGPLFLQEMQVLLGAKIGRDKNHIGRVNSRCPHLSSSRSGLCFPHRSDWGIAVAVTECVLLMKQDGQGLEFRMRRSTLEQSQESTVI